MIYVLTGDDTKSKSEYIRGLTVGRESFFVSISNLSRDLIMSYATNISLFGETPVVILEDVLREESFILDDPDLKLLKDSNTVFIFKEDKLTALEQKKYKKYGEVKIFESKKDLPPQKFNVFSVTDAFARRDKVSTWTLYLQSISSGVEPEALAGILFWKIKNMILSGSKTFSKEELKYQSSNIVSLYHKAHRGDKDFPIGLEQFILSSLSSK